MLLELRLDGLGVDPGGHEVVEAIAQHADDLGRQRLVQYGNRLLAVELVVLRDSALGDVLAGAFTDFLDLRNVAHGPSVVDCAGAQGAGRFELRREANCAPDRRPRSRF